MSLLMIKAERLNVNRCAVPYGISTQKPIQKFLIANKPITDIAEMIIDRVEEIDPKKSIVKTKKGHVFEFNQLLYATGASPFIPQIPNIKSENISPVRGLKDLRFLRTAATYLHDKPKHATVIGCGFIGIEVANSLQALGLKVTIVERHKTVLSRTTEPEFISTLENLLYEHGISIKAGADVVGFERSKTEPNKISHILFSDGTSLRTDFVVLSVGVRPNIELAKKAGIATTPLGVVTNDHLQTNFPHIYSGGDCTEKKCFITGKPIKSQYGTTAVFQGKIIAYNMIGKKRAFPGVINANCTKVYDWGVGGAGLTQTAAEQFGINTVTGFSTTLDKYPQIDHSNVYTKLVFDKQTRRLIGGNVLRKGDSVAQNADWISFAIQMGATIEDLVNYQYSAHPELNPDVEHNMFMFSAKDALAKLEKPIKERIKNHLESDLKKKK
eukprot:Anaeramoba_ignava/a222433_32.p1 GENE.a222433_32~~a222433_32.p1  ORF type:complete len:483 (+),score=134.52 a222433_32:127-1449(+)